MAIWTFPKVQGFDNILLKTAKFGENFSLIGAFTKDFSIFAEKENIFGKILLVVVAGAA
jgi:hypothetical protein